ncbi:uncharacterized protein LOC125419809 [Ziziphus jujuba]|uniref:Uncharacterized protein LOC125419809 n=1 Tax=Ziziphus jujuba TaxID=326968 RepID=A0ABM4ADU3_ZIZJJ|nr:uncharacterized protein LOC125419809 [Ziziphus jujuba]
MEEENVSKDFTTKQITIDIPEKSERPLTKELESECPFIISGSAAVPPDKLSMVTCAAVSPDNLSIRGIHRSPDTRNWIIYKVPNKLRKIRPAAYTPQLVSIGPFHHGKSNLKVMEYHKAKFMSEFLGRSFCNHIEEENLIHEITEIKEEDGKLVEKAQRSYQEETFEPENKKKYWEVPKNILRDACFILELFLRNHENQFSPPDEEDKKTKQLSDKEIKDNACFIFERFFRNHQIQSRSPDKEDEKYSGDHILSPWVKAAIKQDLILLENQLPFFVLDRRWHNDLSDVKDDDKRCWWNCRDRCWWNGRGCCWINGCCGINRLELKIPQLKVDDNTECIFRNVMALEQFVYPKTPRICNYIFLLDQLIDTVEDVVFLVDKGIIENWLGSNKAVAALVNTLSDQIVTPRFFYADICDELNKYHSKNLNVAMSTLNRVHFKDIWTGSSTVVGLVIVVFSFFSTYSTIKNLFFV